MIVDRVSQGETTEIPAKPDHAMHSIFDDEPILAVSRSISDCRQEEDNCGTLQAVFRAGICRMSLETSKWGDER